MRKLILIAAIALLATEAHAGGSRSLSLAASSANQQAEQPATTAPVPPEASQAPAPPQASNVQTATSAPTSTAPAATPAPATAAAPTAAAPATPTAAPMTTSATETTKAKRRQPSTEARVIRELHRHGIYW